MCQRKGSIKLSFLLAKEGLQLMCSFPLPKSLDASHAGNSRPRIGQEGWVDWQLWPPIVGNSSVYRRPSCCEAAALTTVPLCCWVVYDQSKKKKIHRKEQIQMNVRLFGTFRSWWNWQTLSVLQLSSYLVRKPLPLSLLKRSCFSFTGAMLYTLQPLPMLTEQQSGFQNQIKGLRVLAQRCIQGNNTHWRTNISVRLILAKDIKLWWAPALASRSTVLSHYIRGLSDSWRKATSSLEVTGLSVGWCGIQWVSSRKKCNATCWCTSDSNTKIRSHVSQIYLIFRLR